MENLLPSEKCTDKSTRLYQVSWDAFSVLVTVRALKMNLLPCPGSQERADASNRLSLICSYKQALREQAPPLTPFLVPSQNEKKICPDVVHLSF